MPNDNVCIETIEADLLRKRLDDAIAQRDEAVAAVKEQDAALAQMRGALEKAVAVIHSWHNLDGRKMPEEVQQRMWQIYRDDAPEMKPIREALATSLGAETLEYIRGLEGFLAEVRGRYEAAFAEGIDRCIVQAAEAGGAGEILADIVSRRFMAEIVFEPEFYVEGGDAK